MINTPSPSQKKPFLFAFLAGYLPAVLLLLSTVLLSVANNIPIAHLIRDTTAIAKVPYYTGAVSNIGIMLWCSTVAICFFTFAILRRSGAAKSQTAYYLLGAGAFTLMLMLDDAFLFHEIIFPTYLGLSNNVVFTFYALLTIIFLSFFQKSILGSDYILLAISIGLLSTSVLFDKMHDFHLLHLLNIHNSDLKYFLEDAFKLLGIAGWFSYFTLTCFEILSGSIEKT